MSEDNERIRPSVFHWAGSPESHTRDLCAGVSPSTLPAFQQWTCDEAIRGHVL
jgi:hypothetical protein